MADAYYDLKLYSFIISFNKDEQKQLPHIAYNPNGRVWHEITGVMETNKKP
jgi:hypothetical protein